MDLLLASVSNHKLDLVVVGQNGCLLGPIPNK